MKREKLTPQKVKESYDRLKVGKRGLRLRLLKEVCIKLYEGSQNAELN